VYPEGLSGRADEDFDDGSYDPGGNVSEEAMVELMG
jgi:hypothetical protein